MKKRYSILQKFLNNHSGLAALEWAIVMPALALLLAGGYETGRYILIKQKTDKAAFMVGDAISQGRIPDVNMVKAVSDMTKEIVEPFDPKNSTTLVSVFQRQGNSVVRLSQTGSGATRITPGVVAGKIDMGERQVLVATEVFYRYQPALFTSVMKPQIFYKVSYYRPRRESVNVGAVSPDITVRLGAMGGGSTYENLLTNRPGGKDATGSTLNSASDPTEKAELLKKNQDFIDTLKQEIPETNPPVIGARPGNTEYPKNSVYKIDKPQDQEGAKARENNPVDPLTKEASTTTNKSPLAGIYNNTNSLGGGGSGAGGGGGGGGGEFRVNGAPLTNNPSPHPWELPTVLLAPETTVNTPPVSGTSSTSNGTPFAPNGNNNGNAQPKPVAEQQKDPSRVRDPRGTVKTTTPRRFLDPSDPNYRPDTPQSEKDKYGAPAPGTRNEAPPATSGSSGNSGTASEEEEDSVDKSGTTYVPPQ